MILSHISRISNSEATALGLKINEVIVNLDFTEEETQSLALFYKPFNKALYELINAKQLDKHLCNGATKNELNQLRDNKFRGLKYLIKAYILSGDLKEREAAENLQAIIINSTKKSYKNTHNEKTRDLAAILEEFSMNSKSDLKLLHVSDWLESLKIAQFDFINYSTKLSASRAENNTQFTQIKSNYFDALQEFINFIPYHQKITQSEKFQTFNNRIIDLIDKLISKIKAKNNRKDKITLSTDLPEPIVETDEPAKLIPNQLIPDTIDN